MLKICLVLGFIALVQAKAIYDHSDELEWNQFKLKFGKSYADGEEEMRKANYFQRKEKIIKKNVVLKKKSSWNASMNQFSDMTWKEFNLKMNRFKPRRINPNNKIFKSSKNFKATNELDYRKLGYVTKVKNQGNCGSCWAFSATGSLEGQIFKTKNESISLSEQNLVDCSTEYGNNGCNGGFMDYAFDYIKENGINSDKDYPYEAKDYECRFNQTSNVVQISGYVDIESTSDFALLQALLEIGPISVAIDASEDFMFYESGVFEDLSCSSRYLNHGVLLVGYGTDQKTGKKYWLVKNSWGEYWGENGYIRMSRDTKNFCGISTMASYPTIA